MLPLAVKFVVVKAPFALNSPVTPNVPPIVPLPIMSSVWPIKPAEELMLPLAVKFVVVMLPTTWRVFVGDVVPIPTLPKKYESEFDCRIEPVNSCISSELLPNFVEPDSYIMLDDINSVWNSCAVTLPPTTKLFVIKISDAVTAVNVGVDENPNVIVSVPAFGIIVRFWFDVEINKLAEGLSDNINVVLVPLKIDIVAKVFPPLPPPPPPNISVVAISFQTEPSELPIVSVKLPLPVLVNTYNKPFSFTKVIKPSCILATSQISRLDVDCVWTLLSIGSLLDTIYPPGIFDAILYYPFYEIFKVIVPVANGVKINLLKYILYPL